MLKYIKRFFTKKNTKDNFKLYGANVRCLHCGVWSHNVKGVKSTRYTDTEDHNLITKCSKCDFESEWYTGAPVLIPIREIIKEAQNEI